jgi:hypothetical protein
MPDETLKLGVDVDDASLQRAKKRLADIAQEQEKLRNEFLRGERNADSFAKELGNLEKEARSLNKALDALETPREIDVKTEKFDQASRDVALAGDVESNVRTIGGAVGAFGGGAADSAIGKGAEIFAVVEALPRLKEAAAAIPQTFNTAATAMGTSSAGLAAALGVAAVATIAFNFALKDYNKGIQENKTAIQGAIDIIRDYNQFIAGGGTTDAAQERIAELERMRDAEVKTYQDIQAAQQAFADSSTVPAFARFRDDFKEFDTQLTTSQGTIGGYDLEIRKLEEAMANGTTAANDAAQAERDLAAERTQQVLTDAAQAGELAETRERLKDATREQIDAELQSIEVKRINAEAELASLQASGDTSEAAQNRIKELNESLSFLGEKSAQLNELRASAKTDKQVEAEKKLAAAREETSRASDKASQSETSSRRESRQRVSSGKTIGGMFTGGAARDAAGDSDKNAVDDARQKQQEIEQQYQDSLLEAQIDFNREREKEARRAEFELAKIGREAKRAEEDATRERNFAAAADVRESAADQKQDLKDQLKFEQREREIAYRNQQDDLRRTQQNQLRDLQNSLQQRGQMEATFMQNSVNVWQQYFQRLAGMQSKAAGGSGSAQSAGGNQSLSMNSLSYIQG